MIKKQARLPRAEFAGGGYRTVRTPYFSFRFKKSPVGISRVGVVASSAVHKNAAKRNFWKRQVKAALMGMSKTPTDILVVLSPKVMTLTKKEFKTIIKEAGSKTHI